MKLAWRERQELMSTALPSGPVMNVSSDERVCVLDRGCRPLGREKKRVFFRAKQSKPV